MIHQIQDDHARDMPCRISPPPLKRQRVGENGSWRDPQYKRTTAQAAPAINEHLSTASKAAGPFSTMRPSSTYQSALPDCANKPRHSTSLLYSHSTKKARLWHSDIELTNVDTFSHKSVCQTCGKGQHAKYDPIIPCNDCGRYYHDSCRNPPSASGDDMYLWTCSNCLLGARRRSSKLPTFLYGSRSNILEPKIQARSIPGPDMTAASGQLPWKPRLVMPHAERKQQHAQQAQAQVLARSQVLTSNSNSSNKRVISRKLVLANALLASGLVEEKSATYDLDSGAEKPTGTHSAVKQNGHRRSSLKEIPESPVLQTPELELTDSTIDLQDSAGNDIPSEMEDVSLTGLSQRNVDSNPKILRWTHNKTSSNETRVMNNESSCESSHNPTKEMVIPNTPDALIEMDQQPVLSEPQPLISATISPPATDPTFIPCFRAINQVPNSASLVFRPCASQNAKTRDIQTPESDGTGPDIIEAPTQRVPESSLVWNDSHTSTITNIDSNIDTSGTLDISPNPSSALQLDETCPAFAHDVAEAQDSRSSYPSPHSSRAVSADKVPDVPTLSSELQKSLSETTRTYSLREIAGMAIASVNGAQTTPRQAILWAAQHFSHLQIDEEVWQRSLRCALSLSPDFKSEKLVDAPRRNMKSYSFSDGVWQAYYDKMYTAWKTSSLQHSSDLTHMHDSPSRHVPSSHQENQHERLQSNQNTGSVIRSSPVVSSCANVSTMAAFYGNRMPPVEAWTDEEKAQKIASIKSRPSRKEYFGRNCRLAHKRRYGLEDIHDERDGAWKPQFIRGEASNTTADGDARNLRDLFDLPKNVIPVNNGPGELAFRDATLVNGRLPRSRTLYKVGKLFAGELTIRSS